MPLPPIADLLASESPRVEWKENDTDSRKVLRAVAALANDLENSGRAGYVVLGVKDVTGTPVGLPHHDHRSRDLAQRSLENRLAGIPVTPQPSLTIHGIEHEGVWLVVIEVLPYPVPPVVRLDGTAYIRRGTVTRRASEADLQRLNERRPEHQRPFDQRIAPAASMEDLNMVELRSEHAARAEEDGEDVFPDIDAWLVQRGIARRVDGALVPTVMGVLLHAFEPTASFPGATIDCVKYDNTDEDSLLIARKRVMGPLPDQLDTAWTIVDEWNIERLAPEGVGIRQGFANEYPPEALKELVRNLVQHRSYEGNNAPSRITWFSDRIELSNPGGPYGAANEGAFGEHSDYRNPGLTARLAELGYVQRLGRGVRRVRRLLADAGHPALEVETDGFTTIVVRRRP